jgi:predicted house-cleaning noncanonical NTP pyrophosphatase (MazG superfamily)
LFGTNEDVIEYDKVVRDKIPRLIEQRGEHVQTVRLEGDALVAALRQKLVEEAFETLDASGGELLGELADVQEVTRGLCRALKVAPEQMEVERVDKRQRRGGFDDGLMLIKTATPHSIEKQPDLSHAPSLELKPQQVAEPVISEEAELPRQSLYRRPDLRQVEQQIEKLVTFETEVSRLGKVKATVDFSMPLGNQREQAFTLTLELHRTHSSLRGILRLRPSHSQLAIEFPGPELNIESPE